MDTAENDQLRLKKVLVKRAKKRLGQQSNTGQADDYRENSAPNPKISNPR